MTDINDIEITEELMSAVALAQLYREDVVTTIKKLVPQKLTSTQMEILHKKILNHPRFKEVKQEDRKSTRLNSSHTS